VEPLPAAAVCVACVAVPAWAELDVVGVLAAEPAFLGLVVVAVCATAKEPANNNTPTAKLEANSNSLFISVISSSRFVRLPPAQYTHPFTGCRYNFRVKIFSTSCDPARACDTNDVFQSASADLNFMQSG
jgi:hypothetical protein